MRYRGDGLPVAAGGFYEALARSPLRSALVAGSLLRRMATAARLHGPRNALPSRVALALDIAPFVAGPLQHGDPPQHPRCHPESGFRLPVLALVGLETPPHHVAELRESFPQRPDFPVAHVQHHARPLDSAQLRVSTTQEALRVNHRRPTVGRRRLEQDGGPYLPVPLNELAAAHLRDRFAERPHLLR